MLKEKFFQETTPRKRGLEFFDNQFKNLSSDVFKMTSVIEGELPKKEAIKEFRDGLKDWIKNKIEKEGVVSILDLGAGEGNLAKDLKKENYGDNIKIVSGDKYPVSETDVKKIDADEKLPFEDNAFSLSICSFVLPYLKDPVKTINEMIRVTKKDGYILFNGANKVRFDKSNYFFFSPNIEIEDEDLMIYNNNRFSDGDWVLIKVINPNFKFNYKLDMKNSFTVSNKGEEVAFIPVYQGSGSIMHEARDIRDLATFVYKKE